MNATPNPSSSAHGVNADEPQTTAQTPGVASRFFEGSAPTFWTITGTISLIVNLILIVALMIMTRQLFNIKALVSDQLVDGLYQNFVKMDEAKIQTTVQVNSQIPVKFDLPVKTNTEVTLTQDTSIYGAKVTLNTGGLTITDAPADIILPAGTRLPIALNITVPVDASVPVALTVPVDIPLNQTELHEPFVGLQEVVKPYRDWLQAFPSSWQEVLCGSPAPNWCKKLVPTDQP
ncbi:MAG: hypothetical protein ABFD44_01235 [Anaerolineaceae bacterium]